jgi:hypothetical protein
MQLRWEPLDALRLCRGTRCAFQYATFAQWRRASVRDGVPALSRGKSATN